MKRDGFNSRLGALLALIGSAVGLGNLWKFPYMAGNNGGAAFILIYIGFMFLFCLPLMLSEFVIGRRSQSNPVGAFKKLAPGTPWFLTGLTGVITAFIILSFYSVVGGWIIKYLITSIQFGFTKMDGADVYFEHFVSSSAWPIATHLIFLFLTIAIVWAGIKNGIEKYSVILMPVLFLMVTILAIYVVCLPGASTGIDFMIKPDWSRVTPRVVLNALGQGLFSLSLGMGCVITYSSYMKKSENLTRIAILTIVMDLIFALLAGFVILPSVFAFGFSPDQGPRLLFVVLPQVFQSMPGGSLFAIAFFLIVSIAAITSSISLMEVITSYITEELKISRKKALIGSGIVLAITGSLCSLSMGVLSDYKIFGDNLFDFFDNLSSNILMPIGAFLIALFVGWKMKKRDVVDELSNGGRIKLKAFNLFWFLVRWLVPIGIVLIFLNLLKII